MALAAPTKQIVHLATFNDVIDWRTVRDNKDAVTFFCEENHLYGFKLREAKIELLPDAAEDDADIFGAPKPIVEEVTAPAKPQSSFNPTVKRLPNGEVEVEVTYMVPDTFQHGTGGTVDKIRAMFNEPKAAGLTKASYRGEGLVLSLAPNVGANPGGIYLKDDRGDYIGKITRNGRWIVYTSNYPSEMSPTAVEAALHAITKNPKEVAVKYGRLTGKCSCCGAELTDPKSIANGIGPICESKWGF